MPCKSGQRWILTLERSFFWMPREKKICCKWNIRTAFLPPCTPHSVAREKENVVTPSSLVTLIFSLCCSKIVLTMYSPRP